MGTVTTNLDRLRDALASGSYPRNLFTGYIQEQTLSGLEEQLDQRSRDLFSSEQKTAVHVLELVPGDAGMFSGSNSRHVAHDAPEYHEHTFKDFATFDTHLTAPMALLKPAPRRNFM